MARHSAHYGHDLRCARRLIRRGYATSLGSIILSVQRSGTGAVGRIPATAKTPSRSRRADRACARRRCRYGRSSGPSRRERLPVAMPINGCNSPRERQTGSRHLNLSREDGCGLSAIDRESELFPNVSQDEDFRARIDSKLTGLSRGQ